MKTAKRQIASWANLDIEDEGQDVIHGNPLPCSVYIVQPGCWTREMARILLYCVSSLKFLILVDMYSQMFASFDCVGDTTALSRCMSQGSSATHGARGWRVE